MFKVGDKGVTRSGERYEIKGVSALHPGYLSVWVDGRKWVTANSDGRVPYTITDTAVLYTMDNCNDLMWPDDIVVEHANGTRHRVGERRKAGVIEENIMRNYCPVVKDDEWVRGACPIPPQVMFKVGDTGRTRTGTWYRIYTIRPGGVMDVRLGDPEARIELHYCYGNDGRRSHKEGVESAGDLMWPDDVVVSDKHNEFVRVGDLRYQGKSEQEILKDFAVRLYGTEWLRWPPESAQIIRERVKLLASAIAKPCMGCGRVHTKWMPCVGGFAFMTMPTAQPNKRSITLEITLGEDGFTCDKGDLLESDLQRLFYLAGK